LENLLDMTHARMPKWTLERPISHLGMSERPQLRSQLVWELGLRGRRHEDEPSKLGNSRGNAKATWPLSVSDVPNLRFQ
jgi:hypothetical protein